MKHPRKPDPDSETKSVPPVIASPPARAHDALEQIAKAQQGLASAESFWKSAGRFCRLR